MPADDLDDDAVASILRDTRRIALVGASTRPDRPSHGVMRFLLDRGYDVTPVNPACAGATIHGRAVVGTLAEAAPLDMVDVFRAPAHVPDIMAEAIRLGARTVWLQLGVLAPEAAGTGRQAGLSVVMDRCPAIEWKRLGL